MELRRYFALVSAYRWPLLLIPIVAAIVGFGATYTIAPRYVGTATVQIIPEQAEPRSLVFRSGDGASVLATGVRDPGELLAEGIIQTLSSREVAQLVVQNLGLDAPTAPPTGLEALKSTVTGTLGDIWTWLRYGYVMRPDRTSAAIDAVQNAVSAAPVRGSYYMKISATARDPQLAASVANAAVQAYLTHSRRVVAAAATEQEQFLAKQVDLARQQLDAARQTVLDYSRGADVVAGESIRRAVAGLDDARAALRDSQAAVVASTSGLAEAEKQLAATETDAVTVQSSESGPPADTAATTVRTTAPNPVNLSLQERVNGLSQDVAAARARMAMPEGELRAQDQQALDEARRRLGEAEQQLAATDHDVVTVQNTGDSSATNQPATSRTTSPNPAYQAAQDRINAIRQDVAALQARASRPLAQLRAQDQQTLDETQQRLAEAQRQLASTPPEVATVQTSQSAPPSQGASVTRIAAPNPVYQGLQARVNGFTQDLASQQARQDQAAAQVQARETDLKNLMGQDSQLATLNQQLVLASEAYTERTKQWQSALLEEARPVSQVRVIDGAAAPSYPAFPVKILFAGIGLAAGLLLAVVLVFVHDSLDLSVRSAADAEAALDLRLLAVVPTRDRNGSHQVGRRRGSGVA